MINDHTQATAAAGPRRWLSGWLPSSGYHRRSRSRYATGGNRKVLRDGSQVLIRQVRSTDAPLLADGFARLSATSRWMRFLGPKPELSAAELRYLTDIDHHDHEALGALDDVSGRGVGVARYVRSAVDPEVAEVAVTVVDAWQGRGLGAELVAALSERAREEGIRRFTGLASAENGAVAGLARSVGADVVLSEHATVMYEIPLVQADEPPGDTGAGQPAPARSAGTVPCTAGAGPA